MRALQKGLRCVDRIIDSDVLCVFVYRKLADAFLEVGQSIDDAALLELVRSSLRGLVVNFDVDAGTDMQLDPVNMILSVNQDLVTDLALNTLDEASKKRAVFFLAIKLVHETSHALTINLRRFAGIKIDVYDENKF